MYSTSRQSKKRSRSPDPFANGDAWRQFLSLEGSLAEFVEYVPLAYRNRNVFSPKLGTILVSASMQTEATFKAIINSRYVENDPNVRHEALLKARAAIRGDSGNIKLYRNVLEPLFWLSRRRVVIWQRPRIYRQVKPFFTFSFGKSPLWWGVHNDVKHSFYQNARKATLRRVFEAVAALFLIQVMHLEHRETLVKLNVIQSRLIENRSTSLPHSELAALLGAFPRELPDVPQVEVWAETHFFELQLGGRLAKTRGQQDTEDH